MVTVQMSKGGILQYMVCTHFQPFPTFLNNDHPTAPERDTPTSVILFWEVNTLVVEP